MDWIVVALRLESCTLAVVAVDAYRLGVAGSAAVVAGKARAAALSVVVEVGAEEAGLAANPELGGVGGGGGPVAGAAKGGHALVD